MIFSKAQKKTDLILFLCTYNCFSLSMVYKIQYYLATSLGYSVPKMSLFFLKINRRRVFSSLLRSGLELKHAKIDSRPRF